MQYAEDGTQHNAIVKYSKGKVSESKLYGDHNPNKNVNDTSTVFNASQPAPCDAKTYVYVRKNA